MTTRSESRRPPAWGPAPRPASAAVPDPRDPTVDEDPLHPDGDRAPGSAPIARGRCAICGDAAPMLEFLVVTDTTGQEPPRLVCRPSRRPGCFDSVGPRTRWTIALADPATRPSPIGVDRDADAIRAALAKNRAARLRSGGEPW